MQATAHVSPFASAPGTDVVDSVLTALMTVGRTMRQRITGDEIEPGSFWLLKSIAGAEPIRVTALAACTNLDASTVSRQVTQLDRSGLVERTPDPDDGRAHRLQLTAAGRTQLQAAVARRRALLRQVLDRWEPDDVAELDRLLGRFVTDLEHHDAELEQS